MFRSVLGVAALVAAAGCVRSEVIECGDGIVCPSDRVCTTFVDNNIERALCVVPEQLTACDGLEESAVCTFGTSGTGTCRNSLCFPTVCGDGVVSGSEECEIGNQPFDECSDLVGEFYDAVPLGCTGSCLYDRVSCKQDGARYCGDDRIDYQEGEYCDGTSLPFNNDSCLTYGYDAGELTCNAALCTPGFTSCARLGWTFVAPGLMANDMWGSGPDDIYAVGANAMIAHFDGATWTSVPHGASSDVDFYGVYGTSSTDVYVVGGTAIGDRPNSPGVMLHFDGTAWTQVTLPVNKLLNAVWVSGTSGIAVGVGGTVLRLASGAWTQVTSPTTRELHAVWGSSPTAVWIGGVAEVTQDGLYRYDGASVTPQDAPGGLRWDIFAIEGVATGEVFIAGQNSSGDGVAARLAGTSWAAIGVPECASPIQDLWASSGTDVYAAAGPAFGMRRSHTLYHYDGSSWTPIESPNTAGTLSVWGSGASDVYVSGASGITQGDGRVMTEVPYESSDSTCVAFPSICSSGELSVIAGASVDDVYAFGTGTNCYYDGHNWTPMAQTLMEYRSAWVSSDGKAFAVGSAVSGVDNCGSMPTATDAIIIYGQGTGAFSVEAYPTTGHSDLLGVHGTSSSDVYAVGTKGPNACTLGPLVMHYNGATWSEVVTSQLTNMSIVRRVWAKTATEVYVMGSAGAFARYDGVTWTELQPVPTFCPAVMDMKGVGDHIYVTCLSDKILYRFVTTTGVWELAGSAHSASFGTRMRLLPLADNDIFVFGGDLGGNGTISHYETDKATAVRFEGEPINDAWGTANRIFWVGPDGVHSLVRTVPW